MDKHRKRPAKKVRATLTVPEFADLVGISLANAYTEVRSGRVPHIRISPKRIVIPRVAVDRWLETCAGTYPAPIAAAV
jgi:excisionase family DNA binding protein